MITDRIQLAGLDAYFRDPATEKVNLGLITPTIRTAPVNKGKQIEISGIQLLIEHQNLLALLSYPSDDQDIPIEAPLFKISVVKEMFPNLFADPFSHRVHNIAGYIDFKEGTLANGRVMEIDGIPTIVSIGKDDCIWVSKEYKMPDPISIDAIAWELATSKLTHPDSFFYCIKISPKDILGNILPPIEIGNTDMMLKADAKRAIDSLDNTGIKSFQITFTAKVLEDSNIKERHLPNINEKVGRPLLRAINILEPIKSIYEINSLSEVQNLCSNFQFFENSGTVITRFTGTLDISATLVNSINQWIYSDNNLLDSIPNIYHSTSKYEFVELQILSNQFTRFEAKRMGIELKKNIQ